MALLRCRDGHSVSLANRFPAAKTTIRQGQTSTSKQNCGIGHFRSGRLFKPAAAAIAPRLTFVPSRPPPGRRPWYLGALLAALGTRRLARHDRGQDVVLHGLLGHDHLGDVVAA